MKEFTAAISGSDWAGLCWFLVAWVGYGWFSERSRWARDGLMGVTHRYRLEWARQLVQREMRMTDAALVGNLMQSVSFYASTTIYITAGLLAVLGALDQVIRFAADLPFARETSRAVSEVKLLLLLTVFVVAYFKLSILIGASPYIRRGEDAEATVNRLATVNWLAGDEFNRGIRAYYFGIAAVTWFIQPWLFIAVTTIVVVVLYRRDFSSPVLASLVQTRAGG